MLLIRKYLPQKYIYYTVYKNKILKNSKDFTKNEITPLNVITNVPRAFYLKGKQNVQFLRTTLTSKNPEIRFLRP